MALFLGVGARRGIEDIIKHFDRYWYLTGQAKMMSNKD